MAGPARLIRFLYNLVARSGGKGRGREREREMEKERTEASKKRATMTATNRECLEASRREGRREAGKQPDSGTDGPRIDGRRKGGREAKKRDREGKIYGQGQTDGRTDS